jgi:hypothetical protein
MIPISMVPSRSSVGATDPELEIVIDARAIRRIPS